MTATRISSWGSSYKITRECANDLVGVRKEWNIIRDGRRKLQKQLVERLIQGANVRIPRVSCGFYEIERFQNFYLQSSIAIVVYEKPTKFCTRCCKVTNRYRG